MQEIIKLHKMLIHITFCAAIFDIFDSDRGRIKVKIMTISPCSQRKLPEKLVCNISNILEKFLWISYLATQVDPLYEVGKSNISRQHFCQDLILNLILNSGIKIVKNWHAISSHILFRLSLWCFHLPICDLIYFWK